MFNLVNLLWAEYLRTKVSPERCQFAEVLWKHNFSIWSKVRKSCDKIYNRDIDLIMVNPKNDVHLFEILSNYKTNATQKKVDNDISKFIKK